MERLPFTGSCALVSGHPGMLRIFHEIRNVLAQKNIPILFIGETGTGKELFAKSIHHHSRRKNKPFVAINCGAIPENLIESKLFGHEKGAFTGAHRRRKGAFEKADGGTLFLDEIGELPLQAQVKLLRVLQEGEFNKVGSDQSQIVDVRIVAATNRNVEKMVAKGEFREDLYYRLAKYPVHLPPLRERPMDVEPLAMEFVNRDAAKYGKIITSIHPQTLTMFRNYPWPGNVRELESVIEIAVAFHPEDQGCLHHRHFPPPLMRKFRTRKSSRSPRRPQHGQVDREIINRLRRHGPQSIGSLSKSINRSKSTIKDHVRALEQAGKIHVEHRKGRLGNRIHLAKLERGDG